MRFEFGHHYLSHSTDKGLLIVPGGWAVQCVYPIRRWGLIGKGWFFGLQTRCGEPLYPKTDDGTERTND